MSKNLFTKEEMEELSENPYVQAIISKDFTYTDAFKGIFLVAYGKWTLISDLTLEERMNC